jgi:hypothetical protein
VRARRGNEDALLKDLRKQVSALEEDLRARSESAEEYRERLHDEYALAYDADRRAPPYEDWRDERITQIAAAWVLACVFVRFCEDNRLVEQPWIAGAGDRLKEAVDHDHAFFAEHPEKNDRDWLIKSFRHLAGTNRTVAGLFDEAHNPLWQITPSYEAASNLLKFWRRVDRNGEIVHSFVDPELETRFLGDLYQELSEYARKTYALLQTPVFVEEFILDLTLEPAVKEFGLEPVVEIVDVHDSKRELPPGLRTIDPACGSGHFLLGLFKRLLAKWRDAEAGKGTDDWMLIRRTLESVHGCDKNPFAVEIARFRLVVAVLKASGVKRLDALPDFPVNVAVGDSLLHGRDAEALGEHMFSNRDQFLYRTEDVGDFIERCDLLGRGSYHVVVANPPYITVKDKQEKENYSRRYFVCSGNYALSVPFTQRIFELAYRAKGSNRDGGFTGQITANSFMKREFGRTLIEAFFHGGREYTYKDYKGRTRKGAFAGVELTHIIDTSGAYIPGHGTPTVILAGRNQVARQAEPIRAVLGVRGEPEQPNDPAKGHVWQAIKKQVKEELSDSEWVTSLMAPRERFRDFPWSLQGGGAHELMTRLESTGESTLGKHVQLIGRTAHTGADEAYFAAPGVWRRKGVAGDYMVPLVEGTVIRDWGLQPETEALSPYGRHLKADDSDTAARRHLWLHRSHLRLRREPGGLHEEIGLTWYEWSRWHPERFIVPLGIAFAFVATHNHFVLDRGGNVFKQSAPVIKLPQSASEDDHLALLRVLNSSVACFWLKQVSQGKGGSGLGRGLQDEDWEERYEFTGTKLHDFPIPAYLPLSHILDTLAQELATHEPSAICTRTEPPTRPRLDTASTTWTHTREHMIALQEELDWEIYHSYDLVTDTEKARLNTPSPTPADLPQVKLGERAFEIVLARKQATGEIKTAWFNRHVSTPITEIPSRWPDWYRDIVQARIDTIEARPDIALVERPEYKRRWTAVPWDKREKAALRTWLLDRCEERNLWFHVVNDYEQPRTLTVGQLADGLGKRADADEINAVAGLYAAHLGKPNLGLEQVLLDVVDAEHVPYLPAYRYKDSGLRKRRQWEEVWERQREEDRDGVRLSIPVPPKYTGADFVRQSYWSNRGKLDVPKERFISYPDTSPGSDPTPLLGWAGWDQRDQAMALVNIIRDRGRNEAWPEERFVPLLAGLAELMPWLRQWFGDVDEEWGEESVADEIQSFLDTQLSSRGLAPGTLAAWRPAGKTRGRSRSVTNGTTGAHQTAIADNDGNGED